MSNYLKKKVREFYYTMQRNLPMELKPAVLLIHNHQLLHSLKATIIYLEIYNLMLVYHAMSKLVRKKFLKITYSSTL